MKRQEQTYTTKEMLRLINNAGMNLLMRKRKTALESKIERQKEERDYLKDILSGLKIKLSDLDPEFKEAQKRLNELQQTHNSIKAQWESLQYEIDRLQEIQKKETELVVKIAELSRLLGERHKLELDRDGAKSQRDELLTYQQSLNQKKTDALQSLKTVKEDLYTRQRQEQSLIAEIANFDIEGYINKINAKVGELEETFKAGNYQSTLNTELDFITSLIISIRAIDDMHKVIEGASDDDLKLLKGMKQIKENGTTTKIKERLNNIFSELTRKYKEESESLLTTSQRQSKELSDLKASINELQQILNQKEQDIIKETDFRDNLKTNIERLTSELSNKKRELEDSKAELKRLSVNIEVSKAFAEALEPINEEIAKANKRLLDELIGFKEAYEKAGNRLRG
ncbi:MAG: hypothetical protein N2738_09515 [Thermodesulfovibrionales bacterium]|nr:hypothetical protein [Thermodesulfovibrionales bacterium]